MKKTKFNELKEIFITLHGPKGCQWDKEQTHKTLIKDLQEEVSEFIRAVKKNDHVNMKEELGDVLLHVMFNAQIAAKNKKFNIEDVIEELIKKIKRRHPHVFGNLKVKSTRQIIANWNKIKKLEKINT
jgi:tetrapyrrole methylase family protein/MazG family protein